MPTVAECVATALAANATEVFGLLGNGNAFVIDAMLRLTPARYTAVRHEVATVASADAYTRATRRLAIASTTYGAGFTNTATALREAQLYRTPMVVLVGDVPTTGARYFDIDQPAFAATLGVPTVTARRDYAAGAALEAVTRALRERTPVVLALPYDLPSQSATETVPAQLSVDPALPALAPDQDAVVRLVDRLRQARRPLILAGRGARDAAAELTQLADRLGAITVASAPARGLFVGRTLDAGVSGGFSSARTDTYRNSADLVLAIGASLNGFTLGFGEPFAQAHLVQIDVAEAATSPRVDEFVRADAVSFTRALLAATEGWQAQAWAGVEPAEVAAAQFDRPRGDAAPVGEQDAVAAPDSATASLATATTSDPAPASSAPAAPGNPPTAADPATASPAPAEPGNPPASAATASSAAAPDSATASLAAAPVPATASSAAAPDPATASSAAAPDSATASLAAATATTTAAANASAPTPAPTLDPRALTARLDELLPAERLVASDGGHFIGWSSMYLRLPSCDSLVLVGTAFQAIGLGFSSAPGAALAAREQGRMLLLVTGDGGGLMALADLDSLVRTAERATVVVYNDAAYTAEVVQYGRLGLDERPMGIQQVDFAALGRAVGARGTVVRSLADLDEWAAWVASGQPGTWVLDARIDPTVIAPYQEKVAANLRANVEAAQRA